MHTHQYTSNTLHEDKHTCAMCTARSDPLLHLLQGPLYIALTQSAAPRGVHQAQALRTATSSSGRNHRHRPQASDHGAVSRSEPTSLTTVYQAGWARRDSEEGLDEKPRPTPCPGRQAYPSGFVMVSEATCLGAHSAHKKLLGDQPDTKKAKEDVVSLGKSQDVNGCGEGTR